MGSGYNIHSIFLDFLIGTYGEYNLKYDTFLHINGTLV